LTAALKLEFLNVGRGAESLPTSKLADLLLLLLQADHRSRATEVQPLAAPPLRCCAVFKCREEAVVFWQSFSWKRPVILEIRPVVMQPRRIST